MKDQLTLTQVLQQHRASPADRRALIRLLCACENCRLVLKPVGRMFLSAAEIGIHFGLWIISQVVSEVVLNAAWWPVMTEIVDRTVQNSCLSYLSG